jgi:hypothetical protein
MNTTNTKPRLIEYMHTYWTYITNSTLCCNVQVGVDKDPNDNLDTMGCLCSSLLHNCLHFIDTHADQVRLILNPQTLPAQTNIIQSKI